MPIDPNPMDLLQLDIDARLGADVWTALWETQEWSEDLISAVLRLAYVLGYRDSLTERERGKLYRDHGCAVPEADWEGA
jgi:hypothetical protein